MSSFVLRWRLWIVVPVNSGQALAAGIEAEGGVTPCQSAPDVFFPEDDGVKGAITYARQLCAECPVAMLCLEYALDNAELIGVWGGTSPNERKRMLRGRRLAA